MSLLLSISASPDVRYDMRRPAGALFAAPACRGRGRAAAALRVWGSNTPGTGTEVSKASGVVTSSGGPKMAVAVTQIRVWMWARRKAGSAAGASVVVLLRSRVTRRT